MRNHTNYIQKYRVKGLKKPQLTNSQKQTPPAMIGGGIVKHSLFCHGREEQRRHDLLAIYFTLSKMCLTLAAKLSLPKGF